MARVAVVACLMAFSCGDEPPRVVADTAKHAPRLSIGAQAKSFTTIRPPWEIADAVGVTLSDVSAEWAPAPRSALRLGATVRFDEAPKQASSVWFKASCRHSEHVLVDIGKTWDEDWERYWADHSPRSTTVHKQLFTRGVVVDAYPCQIELRVVPIEKGPMYRIQPRYCLERSGLSPGPCPGLIRQPRSSDPRYSATQFKLDRRRLLFVVTAGERFSRYARIRVREDCGTEMRMLPGSAPWDWQWLDPGESRIQRVALSRRSGCTLSVERWREDPDMRAITDRVEVGAFCFEAATLTPGACADATPPRYPSSAPGPTFNVELDTIEIRARHGRAQLFLTLDVEALRTPSGKHDFSASAECGVGAARFGARLTSQDLDVRHMRVGDRIIRRFSGPTGHPRLEICEVVVMHGPEQIGRWCVGPGGERDCP